MTLPLLDDTETLASPGNINPAETAAIGAYGDEYFIPEVKDGEAILVGGTLTGNRLWLVADFDTLAVDPRYKHLEPGQLQRGFESRNKLAEITTHNGELTEDERKLIFAAWRMAALAKDILGAPHDNPHQRAISFDEWAVNGSKDLAKPLSATKEMAMCAEYALLTHDLLRRAGVKSEVVVGAVKKAPTSIVEPHTFLILEEGQYIFDPTSTATTADSWPPHLLKPEIPLTEENLSADSEHPEGQLIAAKDLLTGEQIAYGS